MMTKQELIVDAARQFLHVKNSDAILTHDYAAQVAGLIEIITAVVDDPANKGFAFRKAHMTIDQKIWIGGKWVDRLDAKPLVNAEIFAH